MNATATRIKKATATSKATPKVKADPFAAVKDDHSTESGAIAYGLLAAESDYLTRVQHDGPILAARVHAGESQADIARAMVALAAENGRKITLAAAKMRVSRYVRIGEAIVKGGKDSDVEAIVSKASKAVRNGSEGKGKGKGTPKAKTPATAISAATGTLDALVALVTEKGTAADRDALVALAETFLRKARAAQSLPVAKVS